MDRWLENNMILRVIAVAIATLLWFQAVNVSDADTTRRISEVALQVVNLEPDFILIGERPEVVEIIVRGHASMLANLQPEDFAATVDLRGAGVGTSSYSVNVSVPRGIELVQVTPGSVLLDVDVIMAKAVPVSIQVTGSLPTDYSSGPVQLQEEEVQVSGPSNLLRQVVAAAGRIDVSGATSNVSRAVAIAPVDRRGVIVGGDVTVDPKSVTVTVPISKLPPAKQLPVEPVLTGKPAPGYVVEDVSVSPATVVVRGDERSLSRAGQARTEAVLLDGASGNIVAQTRVIPPSGAVSVTPERVQVTVRISPDRVQRTWENLSLQARNVPEGHHAIWATQSVKLTLAGSRQQMEDISAALLNVYVDCAQLKAGDHNLPVGVEAPAGAEVVAVEPATVQVTIGQGNPATEGGTQ